MECGALVRQWGPRQETSHGENLVGTGFREEGLDPAWAAWKSCQVPVFQPISLASGEEAWPCSPVEVPPPLGVRCAVLQSLFESRCTQDSLAMPTPVCSTPLGSHGSHLDNLLPYMVLYFGPNNYQSILS